MGTIPHSPYALVKKEAPDWGVGCTGPWLNEENGVQVGGLWGRKNRKKKVDETGKGDWQNGNETGKGRKVFV